MVIYLIEAKIGDSKEFIRLDVSTRAAYTKKGMTPGTKVIFRVVAQRRGEVGVPSNEASIYG